MDGFDEFFGDVHQFQVNVRHESVDVMYRAEERSQESHKRRLNGFRLDVILSRVRDDVAVVGILSVGEVDDGTDD